MWNLNNILLHLFNSSTFVLVRNLFGETVGTQLCFVCCSCSPGFKDVSLIKCGSVIHTEKSRLNKRVEHPWTQFLETERNFETVTPSCLFWWHKKAQTNSQFGLFTANCIAKHKTSLREKANKVIQAQRPSCNNFCLTVNSVHIHWQTSHFINQRTRGVDTTREFISHYEKLVTLLQLTSVSSLQVSALSPWPYLSWHFLNILSKVTSVQCYLWNVLDFAKVAVSIGTWVNADIYNSLH